MAVRLFIGNLSYDVTEAELRAHFAALGPLSALALPMDRDTGKPRGFAFVEFRERGDAEEAIRRFNTQLFKGRPLAVSEALVRDGHATSHAPRPAVPRLHPQPPSAAGTTGTSSPPRCRGVGIHRPSMLLKPSVNRNTPYISAPPDLCVSVPTTTVTRRRGAARQRGRA